MWLSSLFFGLTYLIFGCCVGSFINACIENVPRERPVVGGRSACPSCGHRLGVRDLIPVFSWFVLKGRCPYCRHPIPARVPAVELVTGIAYLVCCVRLGPGTKAVLACLFISVLIAAAWIDWEWLYVPDGIPVAVLAIGLLYLIPWPGTSLLRRPFVPSFFSALAGAALIGACLWIISYLTDGGIGGGDIKLLAASAFYLGFQRCVLAVLSGYVLAAIFCVPALITGKLNRNCMVPMVPFFAVSLSLSLLWGYRILGWYLELLR